jgi:hypothetical protein
MDWIKCSERMPELDQSVLIWPKDNSGAMEAFLCKNNKHDFQPGKIVFITASSCCNGDRFDLDGVTHWMPMPEGPK